MTPQPEAPNRKARKQSEKDRYGQPKKDMGGYIGDRKSAGDESNPESLPGGG